MEKVKIGELADAIMAGLEEYKDLATDEMKKSVKKSGKTVKQEIETNVPKRTGKYKKSWAVKTTKEDANSIELTVHSRNRYQLAHLLEFGHAKRGGGRVRAIPHIAPAEEVGVKELEDEIERALRK